MYPTTTTEGFGSDDNYKIIEDNTGYNVTYAMTDTDSEIENILVSQKPYHAMKITVAQYEPNVGIDGGWLDIKPLLEKTEAGQSLYEIIDLMDGAWDAVTYTKADGTEGIYGIPENGFTSMDGNAFVWNRNHLKEVGNSWKDADDDGTNPVPDTLSEFTKALELLQSVKGAQNASYNALGLGGENYSNLDPLFGAFEVPNNYYVDANGEIQMYMYDESVTAYAEYMNKLYTGAILSDGWTTDSMDTAIKKFSSEYSSCIYVEYWYLISLCESMVSNKLATDYDDAHDNVIGWQTTIKGDGSFSFTYPKDYQTVTTTGSYTSDLAGKTYTSPVHENPVKAGGFGSFGYITVIPQHMAEYALYTIDYIGKKMDCFESWYTGPTAYDDDLPDGVTPYYEIIDAPSNAVPIEENGEVIGYGRDSTGNIIGESLDDLIVYISPWSYEHGGETKTGGGFWADFDDEINRSALTSGCSNAMGNNTVVAKSLFHISEVMFDCWNIIVEVTDDTILNPMLYMPTLSNWAPVSILSLTVAKRGISSAFCQNNSQTGYVEGAAATALTITRKSLLVTSAKSDGQLYYYWSQDIVDQMTEWYNDFNDIA